MERRGRGGREAFGRPTRKVCLRWRAAAVREGLASVPLWRPVPVWASQSVRSPAGVGWGPVPTLPPRSCATGNISHHTYLTVPLPRVCKGEADTVLRSPCDNERGLLPRQVAGLVVTGMSPPVPARRSLLWVGVACTSHFKVGGPPQEGGAPLPHLHPYPPRQLHKCLQCPWRAESLLLRFYRNLNQATKMEGDEQYI